MKLFLMLCATVFLACIASSVVAQKKNISKSKSDKDFSNVVKPLSRYIRANRIRIHYLQWNKGESSTILLLHGLNDNAKVWAPLASLLAKNHRVIALDRRGAGSTDKPESGYDFQTLARDVLSFIDKLELKNVHIVGHSAGAGVAVTIAATEPDRIRSLVLVDGGFWEKRGERSDLKSSPPCKAKPVVCRRIAAIVSGNMNYNPEPLYSRISLPTLLIIGVPPKSEAEQFVVEIGEPQSHVEKIAKEKLKNGKFGIIHDTGHWIQLDRPKELFKVIDGFLGTPN